MAERDPICQLGEFTTVRDWLRYGVTAMTRAGVTFGHGTDNAVDEAAFLILSTLDLPIDSIEPWLDCRLTPDERRAILAIIEARISSRCPAPYLTHSAYIGGRRFYVDERVIVPRSFIGELLVRDGLEALIPDPRDVRSVLDLCTGSGCLAILAAEAFMAATVDASDISTEALCVARKNIDDYGLGQRITLHQSDLFAALPPARYDLIIANPPYVTNSAVAAFPPEYAAEPPLAHLGGADGLDLVHRILAAASDRLSPGGTLVVEIGAARPALEAVRPDLQFLWLDTEASEGEVFALSARDFAPAKAANKKRRRR